MIVCSCNCISDHQIREAVQQLCEREPELERVTSGKVLAVLGVRYNCLGCQPLVENLVKRISQQISEMELGGDELEVVSS